MKTKINNILRDLKSINVRSIAKGHKIKIGAILMVVMGMIYVFQYVHGLQNTLNENKEVIYYTQELKKDKEKREYVNEKKGQLNEADIKIITIESEIDNHEECVMQQFDRMLAGLENTLEYCDEEQEDFAENDAFIEDLLKDL